jgi:hypothetical protein
VDQPERDVEPSPLPARVGRDTPRGERGQVEALDQSVGSAPGLGSLQPVEPSLKHEILAPGGELVAAAELAYVPDPGPHLGRLPGDVEASDGRGSPVARQERRQHPQRGRFAGAVGSEEPEDFAGADVDVDAAHSLDIPEALAQAARADNVGSAIHSFINFDHEASQT